RPSRPGDAAARARADRGPRSAVGVEQDQPCARSALVDRRHVAGHERTLCAATLQRLHGRTTARAGGCNVADGALPAQAPPAARASPAFVRRLEASQARATFFGIGRQLSAAYRDTLVRELGDGDALGDHTFSHPDLTRSGDAAAQLREPIGAIRALTGYTPCVF